MSSNCLNCLEVCAVYARMMRLSGVGGDVLTIGTYRAIYQNRDRAPERALTAIGATNHKLTNERASPSDKKAQFCSWRLYLFDPT